METLTHKRLGAVIYPAMTVAAVLFAVLLATALRNTEEQTVQRARLTVQADPQYVSALQR